MTETPHTIMQSGGASADFIRLEVTATEARTRDDTKNSDPSQVCCVKRERNVWQRPTSGGDQGRVESQSTMQARQYDKGITNEWLAVDRVL